MCLSRVSGCKDMLNLSAVQNLLHRLKGPRSSLGFVRVTKAGNGKSILTCASAVLDRTKCEAKHCISPAMVSCLRQVRVSKA